MKLQSTPKIPLSAQPERNSVAVVSLRCLKPTETSSYSAGPSSPSPVFEKAALSPDPHIRISVPAWAYPLNGTWHLGSLGSSLGTGAHRCDGSRCRPAASHQVRDRCHPDTLFRGSMLFPVPLKLAIAKRQRQMCCPPLTDVECQGRGRNCQIRIDAAWINFNDTWMFRNATTVSPLC
jgi:hypothetical protein